MPRTGERANCRWQRYHRRAVHAPRNRRPIKSLSHTVPQNNGESGNESPAVNALPKNKPHHSGHCTKDASGPFLILTPKGVTAPFATGRKPVRDTRAVGVRLANWIPTVRKLGHAFEPERGQHNDALGGMEKEWGKRSGEKGTVHYSQEYAPVPFPSPLGCRSDLW